MSRLSARQTQTRTEFLDIMQDGRLNRDVDEGSGLPNQAYTSEDFFELERQTAFNHNWVFCGFAHQLGEVGDILPVEVAGQPLVLVKGEDRNIRAFHNVCRHRGAQLVTDRKNSRKIVCPNHSWSYSLQGKLIARPHFHGGEKHDINKAECHRADLREVRCETWFDWVFVNLSGEAGDFADYIRPAVERLAGYDFSDLHFSDSLEFDIRANWKLAVENFIEPYHVFSCHPWLNGFVGMDERDPPGFDQQLLYCGYEFKQVDPARGGQLPWFQNLPQEKHNRGDWFVLFPNFCLEIFPDQVDVFIATPTGAETCHETIALYFIGEGAKADKFEKARQDVIDNWNNLNHEDIGVIERMQAGRHSDGFDGGVLSPYWDPVQQHFARLITDSIKRETR